MPQSSPLKPVQLDTADTDALLSTMHELDGPGIGHTAHTRLRYLQKIGFPNPKAGRGKRSVNDIDALLKLALAFEMLDLGIEPSRAAATIDGAWPDLRPAFAEGWRALERGRSKAPGVGETREERVAHREAQVEEHRKLIILSPRALASSDAEPLTAIATTPAAERRDISGSSRGSRARAVIDPYAVVSDLVKALEETLRYRQAEIGFAFEALGPQGEATD